MADPREHLYEHHIRELLRGGVRNADDSISTVYGMTAPDASGRHRIMPKVWNGEILNNEAAYAKAGAEGHWNFPGSFSSTRALYNYMNDPAQHPRMEEDVRAYRAGQPVGQDPHGPPTNIDRRPRDDHGQAFEVDLPPTPVNTARRPVFRDTRMGEDVGDGIMDYRLNPPVRFNIKLRSKDGSETNNVEDMRGAAPPPYHETMPWSDATRHGGEGYPPAHEILPGPTSPWSAFNRPEEPAPTPRQRSPFAPFAPYEE